MAYLFKLAISDVGHINKVNLYAFYYTLNKNRLKRRLSIHLDFISIYYTPLDKIFNIITSDTIHILL